VLLGEKKGKETIHRTLSALSQEKRGERKQAASAPASAVWGGGGKIQSLKRKKLPLSTLLPGETGKGKGSGSTGFFAGNFKFITRKGEGEWVLHQGGKKKVEK